MEWVTEWIAVSVGGGAATMRICKGGGLNGLENVRLAIFLSGFKKIEMGGGRIDGGVEVGFLLFRHCTIIRFNQRSAKCVNKYRPRDSENRREAEQTLNEAGKLTQHPKLSRHLQMGPLHPTT